MTGRHLLCVAAAGRFGSRSYEQEEQEMRSVFNAAAVGAAFIAVGVHAEELVQNGSFEQSNYPNGCCPICGTSVAVPGWDVFRIDHLNFEPDELDHPVVDGQRFVDLNQCAPGWIRQTLPTTAGERYELTFSMGALYPPCNPNARLVRVTCGPIDLTLEFEPGGGYLPFRLEFTALETTTELKFEGLSGGCESARLDAVSVRAIVCPGDLDNSNSVTGVDLAIVLTNWNAPNPKYPEADVNGDGAVDGADLAIVLSNWGDCP